MKTLLQINTSVNIGSTGRIAEDIGELAINKNWNSYIAYGKKARSSISNVIKIGKDRDVIMHGIQTRLFDNHGFASKKATLEFIKEIDRINPSIIHLHNIHGYYINIEILFNYLEFADIPIVWTLHDCWSFTGHCVYFDYVNCNKWKTQCYSCPQKKSYPASLFLDNSRNNYSKKKALFNSVANMTMVPVSYWLGDLVKDSFLKKHSINVVTNGINIDIFSIKEGKDIRVKYNLEDKFVILGVANIWEKRKGLEDFINLSRNLQEDEVIVLVGLSSKQITSLPNNIIGIEKTESQEELAKLYSMADVYFNASVEETFGLTTIEAFACGTPSIVYNKTALPEVIDEKVGWVIKQGDMTLLRNIISELKSEPYSSKINRKVNCRKKAVRLYNKKDRYEEYFELYDKILLNK
ncbi:glycosyltransferase [Arenibacter lacus]|uniref:glycosyltransferase n=1 Tax=Arenibacter lacus TaxID=2608629 RepID=UPI00123E2A7E|nr:glycosyltransferase [Arenibacter lacus]